MVPKLEKLWSRAVLARDMHTCQVCGSPGHDPHHIWPKSRPNWKIRYDPDFGVTLCRRDHDIAGVNHSWLLDKIACRLTDDRLSKICGMNKVLPKEKLDVAAMAVALKALVEHYEELEEMNKDCEQPDKRWRPS